MAGIKGNSLDRFWFLRGEIDRFLDDLDGCREDRFPVLQISEKRRLGNYNFQKSREMAHPSPESPRSQERSSLPVQQGQAVPAPRRQFLEFI